MRHQHLLAVLIGVTATFAGCDVGGGDVTATQSGANAVNGSIHVPAGLHSGAVETVNGSIHIGDNASVHAASTVNGGITMGSHAEAASLSTVNGGVTHDTGARVAGAVTTVNGGLDLKSGADVGGNVSNVNGHIVLTAARVAGGVHTVDGDIDVSGASRIAGGILVEKPNSWFSFSSRKPRIVIGPGAVVEGNLRFERDVTLYVSDQATVGPISGATAVRFSGDTPPAG